jgi:hypothetical protein
MVCFNKTMTLRLNGSHKIVPLKNNETSNRTYEKLQK